MDTREKTPSLEQHPTIHPMIALVPVTGARTRTRPRGLPQPPADIGQGSTHNGYRVRLNVRLQHQRAMALPALQAAAKATERAAATAAVKVVAAPLTAPESSALATERSSAVV